jgi:hypothetical protein
VADTILRTVSRIFFFSLFFPTFDERTTKLHLHAEKLTEPVLHLNLGHLVGLCVCVCACVCSFVLLYASPLMRQLQNNNWGTILRTGDWERTPKLLRLKLHCIWTWRFFGFMFFCFFLNFLFFILLYIYISFIYFVIFIVIFIFVIFYFQSFLCLSNACSAYCRLVH